MRIVISQSMYFPWVGLLEQIRLANVFVHYDDVQYTRGFYNRVEVKTSNGVKWMTIPLLDLHQGQHLNEIKIDYHQDWRKSHRSLLLQAYSAAPYCDDMLSLVDQVFSISASNLVEVTRASMLALVHYFNLNEDRIFVDSSTLNAPGNSSQRLLNICKLMRADQYVTGHGAKNYLDHNSFELQGIAVGYMNYSYMQYPQLHGPFTPFVSGLDLVANCGRDGIRYICSNTSHWKDFINEPN
jgi:WbqC-like protein family